MTRKIVGKAILSVTLAAGVSLPLMAADKPALKTGASDSMISDTCFGCHGTDGASVGPAIPTISGFSVDYFIELMEGFKSGDAPGTIMGRIAKGYSTEEFEQMAAYFSSKPFVKAPQEFDEKLAKKGAKLHDKYCEKCHSEGGQSAEDDSGVLAGQWTPYLKWTMADFIEGHREMTKKMKKKVEKMMEKEGDAGITALLNYYASQQ